MTREETDLIGSMNMCDEISNEAYKKIMIHCQEQEVSEDAVSRQAVNEIINDIRDCISVEGYWSILERMKKLPPVTPKQRTGKWIIDEAETNLYGRGTRIWACHCSECGKDPQEEYVEGTENWWLSKLPNFCPNCGAKMEGEGECRTV